MLRAVSMSVLGFGLLVVSSARAQSACDQARNPHSFACADATFNGAFFPQAHMNKGILLGGWVLLTYADISGQAGPEFAVKTNPQNPRIPEGIVNRADGTPAGILDWGSNRIRINNWVRGGRALSEIQGRTQLVSWNSVETHLTDGRETISFQCRMFLRNGNDHLLCRWFQARNAQYVFRGYMGFLRAR